jgi:putative oxidoreductase
MLQTLETVWAPRVLSIARVVSALMFMSHGMQKLLNFPPRANNAPGPELFSLYGLAGSLEMVGGILLVFGLFTRPVAFILSGEMAFAYWMSHAPRAMYPVLNGGDAAVLYCFWFLYLAFAGGGAWSLDRVFFGKR